MAKLELEVGTDVLLLETGDALLLEYTAGAAGWANIKNMRVGTGSITATDLSHIWFGTTSIAVADIAEFGGVAV